MIVLLQVHCGLSNVVQALEDPLEEDHHGQEGFASCRGFS